jgi:hypothetical protein
MAALVSGCTVTVTPNAAVVAPAPVVVAAPEYYVWDGVEYVGEYNGGYMYLNPGGVWVVCDPVVIERFHHWEGYHRDWRRTAIHNDRMARHDAAVRHDAAREGAERKAAVPQRQQSQNQKKKDKDNK